MKYLKEFCKENVNIKLVFSSFKIKNYFSYKDLIPNDLKSFLVYKFTCASCSSSYIDKTCRHFKTRIEEYIEKDSKSHIFKHLHSTSACLDSYNSLSFKIIDKANSKLDLKIEEALHINWRKPNLNAWQNCLSLFCYSFCQPCFFFLLIAQLFFVFVFCFLQFSFIYYFYYLWH